MIGIPPSAIGEAAAECVRRLLVAAIGVQHGRFVRATARAREQQCLKLKTILARNATSEYGRKYGFAAIRDVAAFQDQVPVAGYEAFRPYVDRMMAGEANILTSERPYQYLLTSGSSADPKYIPVTKTFRREYGSRLQFYYLYRERPEVFRPGAVLSMVSPAIEGWTASGAPFGSASGLTYIAQNALVRSVCALPYDVYTIRNFEDKYYTILRLALERDLRAIIMANPSSILLLAAELNKHAGRLIDDVAGGTLDERRAIEPTVRAGIVRRLRPNPARARDLKRILDAHGALPPPVVWPRLQAVVCWHDASAALYLPELRKVFAGVAAYNLGYAASEGLGTFRMADVGLEALAITSHFFEFCEEARIEECLARGTPRLLICDELERGKRYHIFLTTSGGLYRYHIDDILEVEEFINRTPALRFIQKGTNTFSFTGEKLTEAQVIEAVTSTAALQALAPACFFAVPVFDRPPYYDVYVEAVGVAPAREELDRAAQLLDASFCRLNVEYATKRASQRLGQCRLVLLPPGFFDAYSRVVHRTKRPAQIKFKHLNPDSAFKQCLSDMMPGQPAREPA